VQFLGKGPGTEIVKMNLEERPAAVKIFFQLKTFKREIEFNE
jgi:hypothetical protein